MIISFSFFIDYEKSSEIVLKSPGFHDVSIYKETQVYKDWKSYILNVLLVVIKRANLICP